MTGVRTQPPAPLRVLLVEDDALLRASLAQALDMGTMSLVGAASSAREAAAMANERSLDVLVTDLELGRGPNGVVLAHALRRKQPDLGVVVLTSYADPRLVGTKMAQLPCGAEYITKQSVDDLDVLRRAVMRVAMRGGRPQGDEQAVIKAMGLTDSHIETMRLIAEGLSNAEIARRRVVTEKAVEVTVSRLRRQLGIEHDPSRNTRVEIARAYFTLAGADAPDPTRTA
jgi:DNA-binding NarL/FixJ family response regulator